MKTQNSPIKKLQAKEQEILKKWKNKNPNINEDGVIDWKKYMNQPKKILFILKETNELAGSLREFILKGARWQTWNNVVRWTFGIENLEKNPIEKYKEIDYVNNEKRKESLSQIAIVNLKKEPGKKKANWNEINEYVIKNKELLREQIDLYKPDIIICGGTKDWIKRIFPEIKSFQKTKNGVTYAYMEDKIFICYYHPGARKKKIELYNKLINSLKDIHSKK